MFGVFVNLVRGGIGLIRDALQDVLDFQYAITGSGEAPKITADWNAFTQANTWGELLVQLNKAGIQFTPKSEAVTETLEKAGLSSTGLEEEDKPEDMNKTDKDKKDMPNEN